MYGNNYQTEGKLDLEYKKLAVEKLARDEVYSEEQKRRGLLIGLGNMLIDHNKSRADKNYRQGQIYYLKEYNRDVVHCLVEGMLSGVVSIMGFGPKTREKAAEKAMKKRKKKKSK